MKIGFKTKNRAVYDCNSVIHSPVGFFKWFAAFYSALSSL